MNKWKDCKKEPSKIGKKVLCMKSGDFYVAIRIDDVYIPMPFADHYFCPDLIYPEVWTEIDFPEPYTGEVRLINKGSLITLDESRTLLPKTYKQFAEDLKNSVGKLPKPEDPLR